MDNLIQMGGALAVGLMIGILLARNLGGNPPKSEPIEEKQQPQWWKLREKLTGTQLQILQFMEAHREITITKLHQKFSFIPDRELYYRLEQIVLMQFASRSHKGGEAVYTLNADYSGTVEDDKTVMLTR